MNTQDVLKYGHLTVLSTLDKVPMQLWETGGVCGVWSVKDIVAHLASHEWVLADVLRQVVKGGTTPHLDRYLTLAHDFNDSEVAARMALSAEDTLADYNMAHADMMTESARLAPERFRQTGALPWYGAEYDLDDFIAYGNYGHKREHMAQVDVFRDSLA